MAVIEQPHRLPHPVSRLTRDSHGRIIPDESLPKVQPFNWYVPADRQAVDERMWLLCRFCDWLAAIDVRFDQALPACWRSHPYLILAVDALYVKYYGEYVACQDGFSGPGYFLSDLDGMIGRIRSWCSTSGHTAGSSDCPGADDTISLLRAARQEGQQGDGIVTDRDWLFPATPAGRYEQTRAGNQSTSVTLKKDEDQS